MSTISNKFIVSIIEDGVTLHGELRATRSLTQAYKSGTCIPDWTDTSKQPVIYMTLMDGQKPQLINSGYKWYYNGAEITSTDTRFEILTNYQHDGRVVPALKIVQNLATSTNVDLDIITFKGTTTLSSNTVDVESSINVRITEWTSGGYLGVIDFANGRSDITRENLSVTAQGILYDDSGNPVNGVTYKWFFEGDSPSAQPRSTQSSFPITDSMVVDYVVVRCEFYTTINNDQILAYTAYAEVDDMQDPEYMWIKSNANNGNAASLRKDENVIFTICVGTQEDPTPITSWNSYKVKTLDSEGQVVNETSISGYTPPSDSIFAITPINDYRLITPTPVQDGVATAKLYAKDVINLCKKGLTTIVLAEQVTNN